ncbi:uncharacterized protein LOC128745833 [Sabethes cyaneus]|uniref:uncharacterized protein LOC128745833 n=1 Tax=Sabethes cyaneus TaxID=53552 RepID=UPI00237E2B03|nr:uncharacterized protein LOC128745833 [Sabethes cyaneus]
MATDDKLAAPGTSTEEQDSAIVEAVHLPRLNPPLMTASNIESYFISLEFWFAASGIATHHDARKYNIVMAQVPPNKLTELRSIVEGTPTTEKYAYIKEKLSEHFADSQQRRLHQVLSAMPLGDMKPSQLFNEMRRVAGNALSEQALFDLWASRLPTHAQAAVIASKGDSATKVIVADAIVESLNLHNAICTEHSEIAMASSARPASPPSSIELLQREIAELTRTVNKLLRPQGNQSDRSRLRSQNRVVENRNSEYDICWYHRTFGDKAQQCRKPCYFVHPSNSKNQQ